ncbi:hypothetical protein HDU90_002644 [Geranomyces variabilis]|nr:hypothetical protein HDU90_002644 [Geranomyces variabilis]
MIELARGNHDRCFIVDDSFEESGALEGQLAADYPDIYVRRLETDIMLQQIFDGGLPARGVDPEKTKKTRKKRKSAAKDANAGAPPKRQKVALPSSRSSDGGRSPSPGPPKSKRSEGQRN